MTASISGIVRSAQGQPISGIAVKLIHEPTGSAFAKVSNDFGHYQFDAVRVGGPYQLIIERQDAPSIECRGFNLMIEEVFVHEFVL